jgi:hypothetical protein
VADCILALPAVGPISKTEEFPAEGETLFDTVPNKMLGFKVD